jgi:hypothetical protein
MARIPAAFLSPREREGALPCGEEDQRESDGGERRETDKDLLWTHNKKNYTYVLSLSYFQIHSFIHVYGRSQCPGTENL